MDNIKDALMERDGLTEEEAQQQVEEARDELAEKFDNGEMPFDICEELFGLEPDYIMDLI